jgi:hypothetical protein
MKVEVLLSFTADADDGMSARWVNKKSEETATLIRCEIRRWSRSGELDSDNFGRSIEINSREGGRRSRRGGGGREPKIE